MNQCDGCRRGLPVENGIHIVPGKKGWERLYMVCEKNRYGAVAQQVEHESEELGVPSSILGRTT